MGNIDECGGMRVGGSYLLEFLLLQMGIYKKIAWSLRIRFSRRNGWLVENIPILFSRGILLTTLLSSSFLVFNLFIRSCSSLLESMTSILAAGLYAKVRRLGLLGMISSIKDSFYFILA